MDQLVVIDSIFDSNIAIAGGALYIEPIENQPDAFSITNCFFNNNNATRAGGAIWLKVSEQRLYRYWLSN